MKTKFDLQLFIEQIVEQELEEAAISLGQVSSGSGLCIDRTSASLIRVVLYNLEKAAIYLKEGRKLAGTVLGYIETMPSAKCNAWEITSSAADKGYGPLMYDIAFSLAGDVGLMTDRDSIKKAAKNIWKYNFTVRKDDFIITPLTGQCKYKTYRTPDDNFLDWKYVAKNPINLSSLITAHKKFADSTYQEFNVTPYSFEEQLMLGGQEFFEQRYGF